MSDNEFDDPAFIARLQAGDDAAYRRLVHRFHASMVRVANGIIGSRAQAEEVVQDSWAAVFTAIDRYEPRTTLAAWLFTIVANRARSRIRSEGRLTSLPASLGGDEDRAVPRSAFQPDGHWVDAPQMWDPLDPEREFGGRQLWQHVQAAIERLPENQKAVIVLRDIEQRSAEEACAILGISEANQRVLLHRARVRVRNAIDVLVRPRAPAGAGPSGKGALRRLWEWLYRPRKSRPAFA
ncbi:MAG: sigma-70 family RNA polymerase sigma factor [Rhodospirillales bacterium]|nr:sigma-70 family RNA polymerase sigma factor [Rhodospirillales bacterium]